MIKKILFFLALFAIVVLAYFIFRMPREKQANLGLRKIKIVGVDGKTKAEFEVELAQTMKQREVGLMFRENLGQDSGMLFVFEDEKLRKFWMKDTYISLDIIFISSDAKIVGMVENAEPETLMPRFVDKQSQYVLEINGGLVKKYGINEKDIIINLLNNYD